MIVLRLQFADTKYNFTKKCNQAGMNDQMKPTGLSESSGILTCVVGPKIQQRQTGIKIR